MGRGSMVFYESWIGAIKNLPREVQGEVLTAIIEYGLYGETTESLKPITRAMLDLVKPQIDTNNKRYENGCKGGRKKSNQNQSETKSEPNQNQSETYNDKCKNDICNNDIKEKELSNESPKKKGFDLSFVSPEYHKAFTEWLQYKKDRKETYKTQQSLQKCYTKLINLSGNNPSVAQEIVDQSIANNYAGLFELKKSNKPTTTQQAPAGVTLGKGEWITADGRRTYGQGKANIPMNAPPRPADGYSWDMDNGRWIYQ